jgi:hypothetical protein
MWVGSLTRGQDAVLILPIIWEWDSPDTSASQRSVELALPDWIRTQYIWILYFLDHPYLSLDPVAERSSNWDIALGGKSGTRPIGYAGEGGAFGIGAHDHLTPKALVLNYDSAIAALRSTNCGVPGVYSIVYRDEHDHGNYTLYLQIEQGPNFND